MLFVLWLIVRQLVRLLVLPDADDRAKNLEILVLRQQLRVLRRKTGRPKLTAADRVLLAAASRVLPSTAVGIVARHAPDAAALAPPPGPTQVDLRQEAHSRPAADRPQVAALILRMARENARWGCVRICGELRKLGIGVGATTIRALLRRHGLGPAPRRLGPTWAQFLRVQAEGSWPVTSCGGDDPAQDPPRVVLHPAQHQASR